MARNVVSEWIKNSLYLSVNVSNTAVLIEDTETSKQKHCKFNRNFSKIPIGGRLTSWLFNRGGV